MQLKESKYLHNRCFWASSTIGSSHRLSGYLGLGFEEFLFQGRRDLGSSIDNKNSNNRNSSKE